MAMRAFATSIAVSTAVIASVAAARESRRSAPPASPAREPAYRSAVTAPPPGWTGPVFRLSFDYPSQEPGACPPTVCTWLSNSRVNLRLGPSDAAPVWNEDWARYIQQVLDYVKEGQDAALDDAVGWRVQVGGETRWFHIPWMAYDPRVGREFIHGLTNERTASLSDFVAGERALRTGVSRLPLSATRATEAGFETWAFGVYNAWGAYAIGRSWGEDGRPRTASYGGQVVPAGLPFPAGTVVAKLLFTTATPDVVPYLKGSPVWKADRHVEKDGAFLCERKPQDVRLVQLDVAVVDPRSPTRWVFGTFAYDGDRPGASPWDRLAPVGLQWGSDPWTFPAVPPGESVPPRQSVLNLDIGTPQHFGCHGRLAGPVDNKQSSCLSCHGAAFAPRDGQAPLPNTTPPAFTFAGICTQYSLDNANYFTNTVFPMSYAGGQFPNLLPLDTSLQMQVAFFQYGRFNQQGRPAPCKSAP
jgi:hypothetical protein